MLPSTGEQEETIYLFRAHPYRLVSTSYKHNNEVLKKIETKIYFDLHMYVPFFLCSYKGANKTNA